MSKKTQNEVSGALEGIDSAPYEHLFEYFGLDPKATLEGLVIHRPNTKAVGIANRDQVPPVRPEPLASGLVLFHTNMKFPKLTTGAAMLLGREATRQVVDLDRAQADAYLHRELLSFAREDAQLERCADDGYVLLRHAGFILGLGMLNGFKEAEQPQCTITSLYPKAKTMHDQRSAFSLAKRT